MATSDPLAWEATRRPRAAAATAGAAVLIVASFVIPGIILADGPSSPLLDALRNAAQPGPVGDTRSLRIPRLQFFSDHAAAAVLTQVGRGLGYVLLGLAIAFLARATRARRPDFPTFAAWLAVVGGVLTAISYVLAAFATSRAASDFLGGSRTVDAAANVNNPPLTIVAGLLTIPATLCLVAAIVFVCLNAMRVGLLTRFVGVLGILSAALFVVSPTSLPVAQCFWLLALAVVLAGRWPGGDLPAWKTGEAVPWPTQQELREAREAGSGGTTGKPKPAARPAAVASNGAPATPHPVSRKKRKRRG